MATSTDFIGHIGIEPPLNPDQIECVTALRKVGERASRAARPSGWQVSDDGRCLTLSGDSKYGDPARWLRYLIKWHLKPGGHRTDGVVVGCRRDTKELFCVHVSAGRVSEKDLWPRSAQPREVGRRMTATHTPDPPGAANVIDLASRRARA
jgi:hypothetical protein